jgi:hypothetical protein
MICMGAMHASYILHPMSEGDGHPVLDNAVQGRVCKHEYARHVVSSCSSSLAAEGLGGGWV